MHSTSTAWSWIARAETPTRAIARACDGRSRNGATREALELPPRSSKYFVIQCPVFRSRSRPRIPRRMGAELRRATRVSVEVLETAPHRVRHRFGIERVE